jgi:hypothetical protein
MSSINTSGGAALHENLDAMPLHARPISINHKVVGDVIEASVVSERAHLITIEKLHRVFACQEPA